jgi:nucleotide-binding universal stress UspA family protein
MEIRTILLPTDFSECGNYALSYAASLARTFKATIICVNVIEPIVPTVGYSGMTSVPGWMLKNWLFMEKRRRKSCALPPSEKLTSS